VKSTILKIIELHIFNVEGKRFKTKVITGKKADVNIRNLPSSVYFLRVLQMIYYLLSELLNCKKA